MLWKHLLDQPDLGSHFRREVVIAGRICDFYAGRWAIDVEVDGASHRGRDVQDGQRDKELARRGVITARFTADDIEQRIGWVLSTIRAIVGGIEQRRGEPVAARRLREVLRAPETRSASELRKAQREAADLWRTKRLEAKLPRFTDPQALRSVKYAVERCFGDVSWFDICRAIEKHATDPYSKSPWLLDVWARDEQQDRQRVTFGDLSLDEQERILRERMRG